MTAISLQAPGVVTLQSAHPAAATAAKLKSAFAARGLKLFAEIDQRAEALAAGVDQPQIYLLLVGSPLAGAPIMRAQPMAGLDLPLKVLIWESADGKTQVSLNDASYLAARYHLPAELTDALKPLETLVRATIAAR